MPSQRDVRRRRTRADETPTSRARQTRSSRRDRRRRLVVGTLAVLVTVMMVASLAVGLFASGS